jgi:hypothetical protein
MGTVASTAQGNGCVPLGEIDHAVDVAEPDGELRLAGNDYQVKSVEVVILPEPLEGDRWRFAIQ